MNIQHVLNQYLKTHEQYSEVKIIIYPANFAIEFHYKDSNEFSTDWLDTLEECIEWLQEEILNYYKK